MSESLDINHIVVGDRHRKDFGDIDSLAASIKSVGLLSPIVVDGNNRLVAGHRRLQAVRSIGWPTVPVRRVRQITDAITALRAERDENTCRKDFTPSEAVALGMALEEMERPKAEERKAEAGRRNLPTVSGSESPPLTTKGKTRDIVAPAVGMKPSRYAHAKTVVNAQDDPNPEVASAAKEATEDMDRTGRVETAYRKVRAARGETTTSDRIDKAKADNPSPTASGRSRAEIEHKTATFRRMADEGYTSRQIADAIGIGLDGMTDFRKRHGLDKPPADAVIGKSRMHDSNRIVSETVASLEGICIGVDLIDFDDLDGADLDYWVSSLSESIRALQALRKNLANKKELTSVD